MVYDETLAARVRTALAGESGITERRMFGGLAFLQHGHMVCGVVGDTLMVRVGPEAYAEALARPHTREMDFTGRLMRGLVFVAPEGLAPESDLHGWVRRGTGYAATLPPKPPKGGADP